MQRKVILSGALALAGCMTPAQRDEQVSARQVPPSPELRQLVLSAARTELRDLYLIRNVRVSSFVPTQSDPASGFICLRYDTEDGLGADTGSSVVGTNVINGKFKGVFPDARQCGLATLRWYPLPEAERQL